MLHRLDVTTEELTTEYDSLNFAKVQTVLMKVLPKRAIQHAAAATLSSALRLPLIA